ncbi:hypothetical protein O6H91_09G107700 [Diphasiastrum complanatum]|uniref:Uncharacterized protein n=1 Tax=Diphasiastrum complanatum TaxID=34168 RepID=A0ACC2CSX8_DIPCM|nr:hypothetical protein O6H91_09G107700 [Diphasiastrum complanatum]
MDGKDGQQDTYNCFYGASAKRKRACKLAALIRAAASSKRTKSETGRTVPTEELSKELLSQPQEEEGECSENESCSALNSSSRFLYYEKGEWLDFSVDAGVLLSESLQAGKSVADVFICGCMYLVNFVLMMQINTNTGYRRSIAWIDEKGKCFFPPLPFEGWSARPTDFLKENGTLETESFLVEVSEGLQLPLRIDQNTLMFKKKQNYIAESVSAGRDAPNVNSGITCADLAQQQSFQQVNEESDSDAESVVSCHLPQTRELIAEARESGVPPVRETCKYPRLDDKLVQLDEGDLRYVLIKNKFIEGLGILGKDASVKAIYHDSHTTPASKARLLAFHRQLEVTKQTRGNPNVHYAWHGTSKEGVCGIVLHGFGQPMKPNNGAAFGIGVYLAPEDYSHVSAIYSDYDENGEQHAVLCKVITGNTEPVQYGSEQYHPSSEDYDTGVDNLLKPKRYIVWSTHMNTNILPLYVVNFKLSPEWHELLLALRGKLTTLGHSTPNANDVCDQLCLQPKQVLQEQDSSMSQTKPQSISFPLLLSILKSNLPEPDILFLRRQYLSYKAQRISKLQLSTAFRRVVGDEKLSRAIMSMKKQVGRARSLEADRSVLQIRSPAPSCETSEVCYTNQALS